MRIDSSGNVGIGTTSPAQSLDTTGKIRVRDGGNTTIPSIQMGASGVDGLSLPATNALAFITNSTERMRIDSSGNVGIGASSPAAKMTIVEDLSGPLDATAFRLNASSANDSNTLFGGPVSSGNYSFFQSYKEGTSAGVRALALNPSGGNVGIGTSSPSSYASTTLEIKGSSTTSDIKMTNTTTGVGNTAGYDLELNGDDINYVNRTSGGNQKFWTNSTERMRLDSSGNLLVGGITTLPSSSVNGFGVLPTGIIVSSVANDKVTVFNRNGSDGEISLFQKDGATVGSIGSVASGANLYMSAASGVGLGIGGDNLYPVNASGNSTDGALDIGDASARFKDLYLSGGVYLGGTGSANKLDDFEEGNWTPVTNSGSWTVNSAKYTKVGAMVTCTFDVTATSTISANDFTGLPFTPDTNSAGVVGYQNSESGEVFGILVQSSSLWNFRVGSTQYGLANGSLVRGMFTYTTAS
jgi:hypothetical protein